LQNVVGVVCCETVFLIFFPSCPFPCLVAPDPTLALLLFLLSIADSRVSWVAHLHLTVDNDLVFTKARSSRGRKKVVPLDRVRAKPLLTLFLCFEKENNGYRTNVPFFCLQTSHFTTILIVGCSMACPDSAHLAIDSFPCFVPLLSIRSLAHFRWSILPILFSRADRAIRNSSIITNTRKDLRGRNIKLQGCIVFLLQSMDASPFLLLSMGLKHGPLCPAKNLLQVR